MAGKRGSGAKNKGGTTYKNPKPKPNVRGSGTGKTQYNKNKSKKTRQQERDRDKGKMANIPPTVKSTGGTRSATRKNDNDDTRTKAEKWAAAAEATGKLADLAGERAKASKANYSVSGTKVRSNNASSYNYQPKFMTQQESTSPMVRYDADYEKEKKRLGLS